MQHVLAVSQKHLRNIWLIEFLFFFFKTKKLHFFTQFQHCHQNPIIKQPFEFGVKTKSFILMACVIADQFRKSGTCR